MATITNTINYKSPALTNTVATLISRGNNGNGQSRVSLLLQNQLAGGQNIWVTNKPLVDPFGSVQLIAGGDLLRDIFAPSDDVYAFTDAAGAAAGTAILTVQEGYNG